MQNLPSHVKKLKRNWNENFKANCLLSIKCSSCQGAAVHKKAKGGTFTKALTPQTCCSMVFADHRTEECYHAPEQAEKSWHCPSPCCQAGTLQYVLMSAGTGREVLQEGFYLSQKQSSGRQRGTDLEEERDTASLLTALISFTSEIHSIYSKKHLNFPWTHSVMTIIWGIQQSDQ